MKLENQIKKLILGVLKEFDTSNYDIEPDIIDNCCIIYIKKDEVCILIGYLKKDNYLSINFDNKLLETIPTGPMVIKKDLTVYKSYIVDDFFDFLNGEFVQLLKVLKDNENLLKVELGNILR